MMDRLYIVASHKESNLDRLSYPYLEICNSSSGYLPDGYSVYDSSYKLNISNKNKAYCELSPLYSVWKNDFNYEMIGLGHYRRFLNFDKKVNVRDFFDQKFEDRKSVSEYLSRYMPVLNNTFYVSTPFNVGSILEQFQIFHPQLLDLFKHSFSVYNKQNSNSPSAEIFFRNNGQLHTCNMFYGSKDLVDQWCNQIFNLLFELEKDVPKDLDDYQSRWAGFFAERYLSFFISQISDKAKIIYRPVISFD
jgi:hypothetical protein